jgi:acyl carrier protein
MEREQIRERLIEILESPQFASLQVDGAKLTDETSLLNDVIVDSLQLLEFIVAIERAFGFKASSARLEIEVFDQFGRVIDFVQRSLPPVSSTVGRVA